MWSSEILDVLPIRPPSALLLVQSTVQSRVCSEWSSPPARSRDSARKCQARKFGQVRVKFGAHQRAWHRLVLHKEVLQNWLPIDAASGTRKMSKKNSQAECGGPELSLSRNNFMRHFKVLFHRVAEADLGGEVVGSLLQPVQA